MRRLLHGPILLPILVLSSNLAAADPPDGSRGKAPPAEEGYSPSEDEDSDDSAEAVKKAPPLSGPVYQGVTVGSDRLPPKTPKPSTKGPSRMTWIGFQVRDNLPTVF